MVFAHCCYLCQPVEVELLCRMIFDVAQYLRNAPLIARSQPDRIIRSLAELVPDE
jgi:hypothetical protein